MFDFPVGMIQNGFLDVAIVGTGERPFQMAVDKPTDASLIITNAAEITPLEDVAVDEDLGALEDPVASYDEALTELPVDSSSYSGDIAYSTDEGQLPAVGAPVVRPNIDTRHNAVPADVRNPLGPDASRGERMMAVGVLLAMGLALWWLGGRPVRRPQLLGSLGSGETVPVDGASDDAAQSAGGIGRFIRARSGKPPRLY